MNSVMACLHPDMMSAYVTLAVEKVCVEGAIDGRAISLYSSVEPGLYESVVLRMVREIAAYRGTDSAVLEVPASWWEHFKVEAKGWRWLPKWLRGRIGPIRMVRHEFKASLLLPECEIPHLGERSRGCFRVLHHDKRLTRTSP